MQKVQIEAQTANLRMLMEVRLGPVLFLTCQRMLNIWVPENPGELLRKVRPEARFIPIEQRAIMRHDVHGEVYAGLEPGQLSLHQPRAG